MNTVFDPIKIKKSLTESLMWAEKRATDYTVFLVANIVGNLDWIFDYDEFDSDAQGYTEQEFEAFFSALQDFGFNVVAFLSEKEFVKFLANSHPLNSTDQHYLCYNMSEGGKGPGQKALIPALANFYGIQVCNSSPYATSLCHHKFHVNELLSHSGIPCPKSWMFDLEYGWYKGNEPAEGTRVIVKPIYESMCIGVDKSSLITWSKSHLEFLERRCRSLRQPMIVQCYVEGFELCCPIIETNDLLVLNPIGFEIDSKSYLGDDYKIYKGSDEVTYSISRPTEIQAHTLEAMRADALRIFQLLGMQGLGRFDARVTRTGEYFFFDTNESPPPLNGTALHTSLTYLGFSESEALQLFVVSNLMRLFQE